MTSSIRFRMCARTLASAGRIRADAAHRDADGDGSQNADNGRFRLTSGRRAWLSAGVCLLHENDVVPRTVQGVCKTRRLLNDFDLVAGVFQRRHQA